MAEQVTYSLSIKRALPGYQNFSPFYSVTLDVRDDETYEQAYSRAEELVEKRMGLKIKQLDEELSEE